MKNLILQNYFENILSYIQLVQFLIIFH